MKTNIRQVFKCIIIGIGASLIGILLIPTGILLMSLSVIWKVADRLIRMLEENDQGS